MKETLGSLRWFREAEQVQRRRWRPLWAIGHALWLLLIGMTVAAFVEAAPIPEGYSLVAESRHLRLYMNPDKHHFAVEDSRNGKVWYSAPLAAFEDRRTGLWQQNLRSPFIVELTDERRTDVRSSNLERGSGQVSYRFIERGVEAEILLNAHQIRFKMELVLGDDHLDVRIPAESIEERGSDYLVSFEPFPFFGAAGPEAEGEVVAPIGAGVVLPFGDPRLRRINEPVYGGSDYSFSASWTDQATLPVIGFREGEGAFLAIVQEGEFDATLNYAPAGYVVNYHRAAIRFTLRRTQLVARSRTSFDTRVERDLLRRDRAIRYVFLEGERANYVGMAQAYRKYLMEEKGVRRLPASDGPAPMDLRIFMGAEYRPALLTYFATATTFGEAQELVQAVLDAGVESLRVTLVGWNAGGYEGRNPNRWPPDRRLGGEQGLTEFLRFAKERGVQVVLEDQPVLALRSASGFSTRTDVLRGSNFLPITSEGRYLLNPQAVESFARRELSPLVRLGVDGLLFRQFGTGAWPDWNRSAPLDREQATGYWLKTLEWARENFSLVGVEGPAGYVLGYVDFIFKAPMTTQTRFLEHEMIPFYQLVTHGLVRYNGTVANLRADRKHQLLRQIEYGAAPVFELTYHNSVEFRETAYNHLFSSEYRQWLDDVVEEYKRVHRALGDLEHLFMVGHRALAAEVYETTYEDGTRVIVNYGSEPYVDEEVTVGPLDFAVVRPQAR